MKTNCKFERYSFNQQGDIELTVTIDKRYMQQVDKFANEHDDKYHEIKINSRVTQRTEKQNNAVWKLIREINKVESGESNKELEDDKYRYFINQARIKFEILQGVYFDDKETKLINSGYNLDGTRNEEGKMLTPFQLLSQTFAVVEVREIRENEKGKSAVFICYKGLSSFSKEQNTQFIKVLLDYSGKLGLGVTLESDYLRGLIN